MREKRRVREGRDWVEVKGTVWEADAELKEMDEIV